MVIERGTKEPERLKIRKVPPHLIKMSSPRKEENSSSLRPKESKGRRFFFLEVRSEITKK